MALVDVYAKRDVNGNPSLGDATLIVGDGSTRIEFKQGHAQCEEGVARLIAQRSDLTIPALDHMSAPQGDPKGPESPSLEYSLGVDPQLKGKVEAQLRQSEADLELAKEHLETEGEDVPPVLVPDGFELRTADGEMRCLAAKADGSQCANAAQGDTHACGLKRHQAVVAERQS
jgi:hypothetical protein